jgi:predicted transcriptional regulator
VSVLVIKSKSQHVERILHKIDSIQEEVKEWEKVERDAKQQLIDLRDKMLSNYEELRELLEENVTQHNHAYS